MPPAGQLALAFVLVVTYLTLGSVVIKLSGAGAGIPKDHNVMVYIMFWPIVVALLGYFWIDEKITAFVRGK